MKLISFLLKIIKVFCLFFIFTQGSFAIDAIQIAEMMKGMKLDKKELSKTLDILQQSGQITKDQAESARKELDQYTPDQLDGLKEKAIFKLKNGAVKIPTASKKNDQNSVKTTPAVAGDLAGEEKKEEKKEKSAHEILEYLND